MPPGLREIIEETIGREILDKYCQSSSTSKPIMIPPVPDSKFLEKFPDGELEGKAAAYKELQDGYEAEVKVYRCFEELKRNVIVIHQIEYTHEQYSAFVPEHNCTKKRCKKGPEVHPCHQPDKNLDGETDFVVIGPDFVAVFEVKGLEIPNNQECSSETLRGCTEDAARQRSKMVNLIKHLETDLDVSIQVYQFTIFPNISKGEIDEGYLSDTTLVFSEDIETLTSWFDANIPSSDTIPENITSAMISVKHSLLGLLCTNTDNKWNTSDCSLSKCILDINTKLKRALVTQQAIDQSHQNTYMKHKRKKEKIYPENPGMVDAPELFKKYLDINCLTQGQLNVFNCEERSLWVEGPAGSGKTVVMLGKIIDIVLNKDSEGVVLVVVYGRDTSPAVLHYQEVLNSISEDIECTVVEYNYSEVEAEVESEGESEVESEGEAEVESEGESEVESEGESDVESEGESDVESEGEAEVEGEGEGKFKISARERSLIYPVLYPSRTRIVILALSEPFISSLAHLMIRCFKYVFMDDYQKLFDSLGHGIFQKPSYRHAKILSEELFSVVYEDFSTDDTSMWVFSDMGQCLFIGVPRNRPEFQTSIEKDRDHSEKLRKLFRLEKSLSVNLRNTHEISSVLSIIREHYNTMCYPDITNGALRLPRQIEGHFLRGTKPTIYLLKGEDPAACERILEEELRKLTGPGSCLDDKDIAVLLDSIKEDVDLLLNNIVNSVSRGTGYRALMRLLGRDTFPLNFGIAVPHMSECSSAEWPAVVYIHRSRSIEDKVTLQDDSVENIMYSNTILNLYQALSRARVYSTVIIYNYTPKACEYTDKMLSELRERRDICRIVDVD